MYKISLRNVGSDMVTRDETVYVDTFDEAMIFAKSLIQVILGYTDFTVLPMDEQAYSITHHETLVGSFSIVTLN